MEEVLIIDGHKICSKCKQNLSIELFSHSSEMKSGYRCQCKSCESEYRKKYCVENKEKERERKRIWRVNNKDLKNEIQRVWRKKNKPKLREYKRKNRHTEHGRLCHIRNVMKRRKGLKTIELFLNPFPDEIEVEYHHINNLLVVPLPKSLHQSTTGDRELHRKKCSKIIKDIYGLDIDILLGDFCDG